MDIKDGGFSLKTKELNDGLDHVIYSAYDSSIISSIKGAKDVASAKKLIKKMQEVVTQLNSLSHVIEEVVLQTEKKKPTFIIKEK